MAVLPRTDHDVPLPAGLNDCTFCRSRLQLYVEAVWDWGGAGELVRVGCLCDGAMAAEEWEARTLFEYERQTVAEWNRMHPEDRCQSHG